MTRRAGLAVLALALPLLTPPTAHAVTADNCLQHPMQTLPGVQWQRPEAMSPAGRFAVGHGERPGVGDTLIRWHDGVVSEVGVTAPEGLTAGDVSDDGQIAFNRGGRSFRYRDGVVEELPMPTGYSHTQATRIDNGHGSVIGMLYNLEQTMTFGMSWDATNKPRVLAIPAGFTESRAADIADDGTIVGAVTDWPQGMDRPQAQRAALWRPDGSVVLLPKTSTAMLSDAVSIENGVIEGREDNKPVRWQVRDQLPTPITTRWPVVDTNPAATVLYDDSVDKPGTGNRPLERSVDDPTLGRPHPLGLTADDQVYGWDEATLEAVRWDCS